LFGQGVSGYAPLRRNRRRQLEELRSGDGRGKRPTMTVYRGPWKFA